MTYHRQISTTPLFIDRALRLFGRDADLLTLQGAVYEYRASPPVQESIDLGDVRTRFGDANTTGDWPKRRSAERWNTIRDSPRPGCAWGTCSSWAVPLNARSPSARVSIPERAAVGAASRSVQEARILEEVRQRYLLSYTARGVAPGGWHRLEVRVKDRRVDVKARRGYQAGG